LWSGKPEEATVRFGMTRLDAHTAALFVHPHTSLVFHEIRLRPIGGTAKLQRAAEVTPSPADAEARWGAWEELFDGKTLDGWRVHEPAAGRVQVEDGQLVLDGRQDFAGLTWVGDFPKMNYEVVLEGKRIAGGSGFGAVFPVGEALCALGVGSRDGTYVGIGFIDGSPAAGNPTTRRMAIEDDRWYHVRLQVTEGRIQMWRDGVKVVDFLTEGHRLTVPWGYLKPFGPAVGGAKCAYRTIRLRRLLP
jgi:hypothetical protein